MKAQMRFRPDLIIYSFIQNKKIINCIILHCQNWSLMQTSDSVCIPTKIHKRLLINILKQPIKLTMNQRK